MLPCRLHSHAAKVRSPLADNSSCPYPCARPPNSPRALFPTACAPTTTLQWFLCVFVNTLPFETSLRVLDLVLFEGCHLLLHTSIALLRQAEPTLLAAWNAAHDTGALFRALKRVGERVVDADALVDAALALAGASALRLSNARGSGTGTYM